MLQFKLRVTGDTSVCNHQVQVGEEASINAGHAHSASHNHIDSDPNLTGQRHSDEPYNQLDDLNINNEHTLDTQRRATQQQDNSEQQSNKCKETKIK